MCIIFLTFSTPSTFQRPWLLSRISICDSAPMLAHKRVHLFVFVIIYWADLTYLTHEDVKYPCGSGQRKGCEENSEKPGWCIHGGVKALSLEVHVELWELFLRGEHNQIIVPPSLPNCHPWCRVRGFYLDHEFKLVHAQSQFSHAGFKELS